MEKNKETTLSASNLIPVCAWCKKIRDVTGSWVRSEPTLHDQPGTQFTHGLCPDCARKWHPDWDEAE